MLFCETGSGKPEHFDELAVFVDQLNRAGIDACIPADVLPPDANRYQQYDAAAHLSNQKFQPEDQIALIGAHLLPDQRLAQLRHRSDNEVTACIAFGSFSTPQAVIGTKAKLSYIFGRDPVVNDVAQAAIGISVANAPVFGVALRRGREPTTATVLIIAPPIADATTERALNSLAVSRKYKVIVLIDGKSKQTWNSAHGNAIPIYQYGELLPAQLAPRIDVCATFLAPSQNYRMQCLLANLTVSGATLLDCGQKHAHMVQSDAFIAGPRDLYQLNGFLQEEILPNLSRIHKEMQRSRAAQLLDVKSAVPGLSDGARLRRRPKSRRKSTKRTVLFVPTNGVGLGHAQRCSLIAGELDQARIKPLFAAFPSCMKMLMNYGFDTAPLVSRSSLHRQGHENDLLNYSRLRQITETANALVFDGGYVFDSIYRSIAENHLAGIWIRRGLWQAGQDNSIALDREKNFAKVIVPLEAFDELNQNYSVGAHVHCVGPIVQVNQLAKGQVCVLRHALQKRFGTGFDRLVVTMLGGGVAASRRAQLQAICSMFERRSDTLHLIVVWPTATVEANAFNWSKTRVVRTHHASPLVAAADLFISATGYNSFHEVIYNRVPTIFMPQMSAFMDDQRARAVAAVEREVAVLVEPNEMLLLDREITAFLDDGKSEALRSNLAKLELPHCGNIAAASIIERALV